VSIQGALTSFISNYRFRGEMLSGFQFIRCSTLWHAIYIACMALVFSYVCFDVLDLDGSNFPLKRHPLERAAIIPEVSKNTVQPYGLQRPELRVNLSTFLLAPSGAAVGIRITTVLKISHFESVRTRGYRIALPRSSISDSFDLL
jgi:hypothetical protein